MSTHAMLIQSLKHKAHIFKLSIPLILGSILSGCYGLDCSLTATETGETYNCPNISGQSTVPVIYNLPVADGQYDNRAAGPKPDFLPSVTFPNGIPSGYVIRLNGAEIQDDFVVAADGITLRMKDASAVGGDIDGPAVLTRSPLVTGAMREGRNTFQVLNPSKALIAFEIDLPSADIHVQKVDDGWNGVTSKVCRGGWNGGNPPHTRCTNYNKNSDVATYDNGGVITARKYYPQPKRGNILVDGYLDGGNYSSITSMQVQMWRLDANGNPVALAAGNGRNMTVTPGNITRAGDFFLALTTGGGGQEQYMGGFETPSVAGINGTAPTGFQYSPVDSAGIWTYSGSGLTRNGSAFTSTSANTDDGLQALFIQGTASAQRQFTTLETEQYHVRFMATQRNGTQGQQIAVDIDGVQKGLITPIATGAGPAGRVYMMYSVNVGTITAGTHTLRLRGTNPLGTDNTAFIDEVYLSGRYQFSFNAYDVGNNDNVADATDADLITITVIDSEGSASKSWLRPNIPLHDERLKNGGGFSIAFDQVSFLSTGAGVMDLLVGTNLAAPDTIIVIPPAGSEKIQLTLPNSPAGKGRLNVVADLKVKIFLNDVETGLPWPLPSTCDIVGTASYNRGGTNYTQVATVTYSANVDISVNAGYAPVVELNNDDMTLANLDACGIGVGGLIGTVKGVVLGIIKNTIGGLMANDLPATRFKFGLTVPGGEDFGPFYLGLHPQIKSVKGSYKTGTTTGSNAWLNKWVLDIGVHTRGIKPLNDSSAVRNMSLGSTFSKSILQPAALNKVGNETVAAATSLGVTLTEDFLNEILMGLWESGFLYLDFAFDSPALSNPFLTNVKFSLTSAQPWDIQVSTQVSSSMPNALITIPDLLINFSGDRYFPAPTSAECLANGQASNCTYLQQYEFARMVGDVIIYAELKAAANGQSLQIRSTQQIEVTVTEVSSDWDGTTEAQLVTALDAGLAFLTGSGALEIPFPEILSSNVNITNVVTDNQSLYVTIDVYNPICFPSGPDTPSPSNPTYDFTCQR